MYTIVKGVGDSIPNVAKINTALSENVPIGLGPNRYVKKTDAMPSVDKLRKLLPDGNFGLARVVGVEAIREYLKVAIIISPEKHPDVFLSQGEGVLNLLVGLKQLTLNSFSDPYLDHSVLSFLVENYGQEWSPADTDELALAKFRISLNMQRQIIAEAEEKAAKLYENICLVKRRLYQGKPYW